MIRFWRPALAVALAALVLLAALDGVAGAKAGDRTVVRAAPTTPKRILIVSIPRLTWKDIVDYRPRTSWRCSTGPPSHR